VDLYDQTVGVTFRISSKVCNSGERPPWTQKNCLFMMAANGRAQNEFMHASYIRSEYFRLPGNEVRVSQPSCSYDKRDYRVHSSLKVK